MGLLDRGSAGTERDIVPWVESISVLINVLPLGVCANC